MQVHTSYGPHSPLLLQLLGQYAVAGTSPVATTRATKSHSAADGDAERSQVRAVAGRGAPSTVGDRLVLHRCPDAGGLLQATRPCGRSMEMGDVR
jgi:hypothetical protein